MGKNGKKLFDLCNELRFSQGFYGRLYRQLSALTSEQWQELEKELPDFTDDLDIIMFLEG